MTRRISAKFFQDFGENTCSLQPALISNAPDLEIIICNNGSNQFGFKQIHSCETVLIGDIKM